MLLKIILSYFFIPIKLHHNYNINEVFYFEKKMIYRIQKSNVLTKMELELPL